MHHAPLGHTHIEALTLVVVSPSQAAAEPYWGHPPEDDGCHVFVQDPTESAFLFDLRLRECLQNPTLLRSLRRAVLVCDSPITDKEFLRRARLVSARVHHGGELVVVHDEHAPQASVTRVHQLAAFLQSALRDHNIEVKVMSPAQYTCLPSTVDPAVPATAPLTAVWQRIQRVRRASARPL